MTVAGSTNPSPRLLAPAYSWPPALIFAMVIVALARKVREVLDA